MLTSISRVGKLIYLEVQKNGWGAQADDDNGWMNTIYVDVLYFHNIDVLRCSYLEGGKITTDENKMWFERLVLVVFRKLERDFADCLHPV